MRFIRRSQRGGIGLAIAAVSGYVLAFILFYPQLRAGGAALAVLPVAFIAWLGGAPLGLLAGLLSLPVNTLLLNLVAPGYRGWDVLLQDGGGPGSLAIIFIGLGVGRLHDVQAQMTRQLAQRQQAEAALGDSEQSYQALLAAAKRQTQELSLKDQVRQALARELELPLVIQTVVEGIAQTFGYTLVSLYLLDGVVLELQHQVGYNQVIERFPISQGISGRVVRTGQPVLLEDVHSDPAFLGAIEGIISEVCVPLSDQGRVVGILNVESTQGVTLTEADLHLMLALSEEVGIAIGRARLYAGMRESQQRFESAVQYAAIGMALVAPDGRWLQVNPALCRLVGYSENELLATSFQAMTYPDDLEIDLDYVRRMLAGEIQTYQMEKRYFHKRGHVVWVLLSVSLVRDSQDRPLYFISQIQDITERKQAEAALRETNEKLTQGLTELEQHARQMEVLNAITRAAIETSDFRQMLPKLADRLGELLNADAAYITLWDEGQQQTIPAAASGELREAYPALRLEPGEVTMTASVLRTGHTLVAEDVFNTSYISPRIAALFPTRSILGLPLITGVQKLGAALIAFHQPHHFNSQEIALGEQAAGQIALAIAKVESYDAEHRRATQLAALQSVSQAVASSLELGQIFETVVQVLHHTFGYRYVSIYRLDGQTLRLGAQVGCPAERMYWEIPIAAGIMGRAVRTRQPQFVQDVTADPNFLRAADGVESEICVPLLKEQTVLGTLDIEAPAEHPLTEADLTLLITFAGQVVVAIDNARLFESERHQRELAEALREAGAALSASLDFETVLDCILEQIGRVVPYDAANLMLLDSGRVRVARMRGYEQLGQPVARDIAGLSFEISTTANLRRMVETGQPLVIPDTAADPDWVKVEASAHMRSWAGAPIVAQGQVIAFFSVDKTEPGFFRPEHGERLAAFAGQAAAALENARLHAEVKTLATIDSLTGLPNRRAFDRAREQEVARAERFGHSLVLIVLDIDSFKQYNDTYGHPAGDERLRAIAHLLQDIVRAPDFAARHGGEEFAVLLPQTNKQGGLVAAERIRAAAEAAAPAPTSPGSYGPGYTFSLGVAAFPEDAQTSAALLLAADNAELTAKRNGKNRVCVAST